LKSNLKKGPLEFPRLWRQALYGLLLKIDPYIDQIRMVNSGTEACMNRFAFPRLIQIVKKSSNLYGVITGMPMLSWLWQAESGAATFGTPK